MTTICTGGRAREGATLLAAVRARAEAAGRRLSPVATLSGSCVALGLCATTPRPMAAAEMLERWLKQTEGQAPAEAPTSWRPPMHDDEDRAAWSRLLAKLAAEGLPATHDRWQEAARSYWRRHIDYRGARGAYPFPNAHRQP